jgi:tetratricopeptide (TPR) repeat protein
MAGSRIEKLRAFIESRPEDPFPRYALALELKNAGRLAEAWQEFETLLGRKADYTAAYLHAGHTLVGLGRVSEAKAIWTRGVEVCARAGDAHARGELESALLSAPA